MTQVFKYGAKVYSIAWDGPMLVSQAWGCTDVTLEPYNPRHPECARFHEGVDVYWTDCCGLPLYATYDGVIAAVGGPETYYGPIYPVLVPDQHFDGGQVDIIYAHVSAVYVQAGQRVVRGQHIADFGTQGASTGCHLHYEVRPRGGAYGTSIDPASFLDTSGYYGAGQ